MFSKRDILQKIATAILGGSALAAIPTAGMAEDKDIKRYLKTIALQQEVIVAHKLRDPSDNPQVKEFLSDQIGERFGKLLTYMMDNFSEGVDTKSVEAYQECRRLFNTRSETLNTMTVEGLQQWLDVMIPVVVVRRLLAHERCTFKVDKMPAWDRFVELYKDVILEA